MLHVKSRPQHRFAAELSVEKEERRKEKKRKKKKKKNPVIVRLHLDDCWLLFLIKQHIS